MTVKRNGIGHIVKVPTRTWKSRKEMRARAALNAETQKALAARRDGGRYANDHLLRRLQLNVKRFILSKFSVSR